MNIFLKILFTLFIWFFVFLATKFEIGLIANILEIEKVKIDYDLIKNIFILFLIVELFFQFISETIYAYISYIFSLYSSVIFYILIAYLVYKCIIFFTNTLNKKLSIFILVIIPISIVIYGFINANHINIDYVKLQNSKIKEKIRICHLSDIHLGFANQKKFSKKIVDEVIKLNPNIVVITGDLSDGTILVESDWLIPFNKIDVPILYITGNHEDIHGKKEILDSVSQTKIRHLFNGIYKYSNINFIGIDFEYQIKETLDKLINKYNTSDENINILLYHIPKIYPSELQEYNIFLMLAGHTHGGQLFPFNIFAYLFNKCFVGLYKSENSDNYIYVSSGIGASVFPIRVGSKSVIGVIDIE